MPLFADSAAPFDSASPGAIGGTTPAAGTFTTLTTTGNIELGNASDTTISRSSAGVIAVEGVDLTSLNGTTDPRLVIEYFQDFDNDSNAAGAGRGTLPTTSQVNGAGSALAKDYNFDTKEHQGIVKVSCGSSGTSQSGVGSSTGTGGDSIFVGGGEVARQDCIRTASSLRDVTDEYTVIMAALTDHFNFFGGPPTNFIGLIYDRLSYGVNWQLLCRKAGVDTVVDTGIVYATNTWITGKAVVNADATSVQAYINGTAAGTAATTNIPLTTINLHWISGCYHRAGANRDTYIDWCHIKKVFTAAR